MTIPSLDPTGELGRLFSAIQPKAVPPNDQRQSNQVSGGRTNDDVALSAFAQEVRDLTQQGLQEPDIRHDRVQAAREVLQRDQTLASSEQVADALSRDTILNALALS
ncbi:flagellar biosynthesis anti-sigma factor FlgM [Nitrospira sp. M1]